MTTFTHSLLIIDTNSPPTPGQLRVEAWSQLDLVADMIAHAITDSDGRCELWITDEDLEALFGDLPPVVYFRVWKVDSPGNGTLLADTSGTQTWSITGPEKQTRIRVDTATEDPVPLSEFVVRGYVTHVDLGPLVGASVAATDMRAGPDADLGTPTTTVDRGFYQVSYPAEELDGKHLPDIKVTVTYGGDDYVVTRCQAPPTSVVNVTVGGTAFRRAEYDVLLSSIEAVLDGANVASLDADQIERVACSARRTEEEVGALKNSASIAAAVGDLGGVTGFDVEAAYGLLRQGLPATLEGLLGVPRSRLQSALERAQQERQIGYLGAEEGENDLGPALDALRDAAVALAKRAPAGGASCNLDDLLRIALPDDSPDFVRTNFLKRYCSNELPIDQFWTAEAAPSPEHLGDLRDDAQLILQLGALTRYHEELVTDLWEAKGTTWDTLEELAAWDESDWLGVIVTAPSGISTKPAYAALLVRTFETAMPTRAIAGRFAKAAAEPTPPQVIADVSRFFGNNTDFDFDVHRVASFWTNASFTGIDEPNKPAALQRLKSIERLTRMTKRQPEIELLYGEGLTSARSIVRYGRSRFVSKFGASEMLGNSAVAEHIYDQALRQANAAMQMKLLFDVQANSITFRHGTDFTFPSSPPAPPVDEPDLLVNWPSLFGSLSACACTHCRSIFGPAAYLTDLLGWLGRHAAEAVDTTAWEVLDERRPDIGQILLNCKNTDTQVPYIDLVNELLEQRVTGATLPDPIQTTGTTEELLAAPEYLDAAAYNATRLAGKLYPWTLPYSLWHHQCRVYLQHLGVPRAELAEKMQRAFRPTQIPDLVYWFRADLGLRTADGRLTEWHDLSGHGHVALQAEPSKQPIAGIFGAGEKPYIEFSGSGGTGQHLRVAPAATLNASSTATLVVVASDVAAADAHFVAKGALSVSFNVGVGRKSSGEVQANYNNALRDGPVWPAETSTASFVIVEMTAGAGTGQTKYRVDKAETLQSSQTNQMVATPEALYIGAEPSGAWPGTNFNRHLSGRIYELIYYPRALTSDEIAALEAYLSERYQSEAEVYQPTPLQIAQERLTLTKVERDILTSAVPNADPWLLWGLEEMTGGDWSEHLLQVSNFLDASGIEYDELRELIDTGTVASMGDGTVAIEPQEGAEDPCDLASLFITNLAEGTLAEAWDTMQRLLRLRLRLGWPIRDLDVVLSALGGFGTAADQNEVLVEALGDVRWLAERFPRLSRLELASWWGLLDIRDSLERPSFYATLFLARTMLLPGTDPFTLTDGEPTGTGDLPDHRARILAATRANAADFALLVDADAARIAMRLPRALTDLALSLDGLSRVFRLVSFARAARLRLADVLVLQAMSGLAPLAGDDSSHDNAPAETRRFLSVLDRLKGTGLSIDKVHYLIRHVSPAALDIAAEDRQAQMVLDALEARLGSLASATTFVEDADGAKLRPLLAETLATASPARTQAAILLDVETVAAIVAGTSSLAIEAQRHALRRILGDIVDDIEAIVDELCFRPQELDSCELWLEPSGIQVEDEANALVSGWTNLAEGPAIVSLPTPNGISGLVLWLRADRGVTLSGDAVTSWEDEKREIAFAQATGANRPLLIPFDPDFGGRPSIQFDGSNDALVNAAVVVTTSTSHTWSLVVRSDTADASSRWLFESEGETVGGGERVGFYWTSTSNSGKHGVIDNATGGDFTSSVPDTATQDLIVVFDGGGSTARLIEAGTDRGTVTYTGREFARACSIGSIFNGGANHFDGRIAEIVIHDRVLTAAERGLMRGYLSNRYAGLSDGPQRIDAGPFGLPAVRLDGVKDHLLVDHSYAETSHTFVAVVSQRSAGTAAGMALLDVEDGPLVCAARREGADAEVGYFADAAWADNNQATVVGDQILSWVLEQGGDATIYRNGTALGGPISFSASVGLDGVIGLGGRLGSSVSTFDGSIACAGLFSDALSGEPLRQMHDYLLTMTRQPPRRRFEVIETQLLDVKRTTDARNAIVQALSSAYGLGSDVTQLLLDQALHAITDPTRSLMDELMPASHGGERLGTSHARRSALIRFGKAATIARALGFDGELLSWVHGEYRDPAWLQLDDLPTARRGVVSFDATGSAIVAGAFDLPAGMTNVCATSARSARTGASTVRTDFQANAARAQSRDGVTWGLLVEPARTNLVGNQDLSSTAWSSSGIIEVSSAVVPTGETTMARLTDLGTGAVTVRGKAVTVATSTSYCVSSWMHVELPAPTSHATFVVFVGMTSLGAQASSTEEWLYATEGPGTFSGTSASAIAAPRAGTASDTGATRFWGMQLEQGTYPTSFIGADGSNFARAADKLSLDPTCVEGGYFRAVLHFAPLYANTEVSGDHSLIYLDDDNRLYFRGSDDKLVLRIGGVDLASEALTFSRLQMLRVEASHGPSGRKLIALGATTGNGVTEGAAAAAIGSLPSAVYLFGDDDGTQQGAELYQLTVESLVPGSDLGEARRRFSGLMRLVDVAALGKRLGGRGDTLASLFAGTSGDAGLSESSFLDRLAEASGVARSQLDGLVHSEGFDLSYPADYRTEASLMRVFGAADTVARLGVEPSEARSWVDVDGDADAQRTYADGVVRAAKAKHEPEAWLEVARPLRDQLRAAQRDALVEYIVEYDADVDITSRETLLEKLLVDIEMDPCCTTSRIVFATASTQLFIHRILLGGLEPVVFDKDARDEWQWRKTYRVWEANRKVFIWPENWIEPDLRDDKTPLFKAFESQLRQADVTDETCENAYRDYLSGLDEVADLRVVGLVQQTEEATEQHRAVDNLHVFAQTRGGSPYVLYYRRWIDRSSWTPWEKMPVDSSSLVYLPRVEHGRLSLHWPMLTSLDDEDENPNRATLQLATTHFDQRAWSTPKTTKLAELKFKPHYVPRTALVERIASTRAVYFVAERSDDAGMFTYRAARAPVNACTGELTGPGIDNESFNSFRSQRPIGTILADSDYVPNGTEHVDMPLWDGFVRLMSPGGSFTIQTERIQYNEPQPLDCFFIQAHGHNLFAVFDPPLTQTRITLTAGDDVEAPRTMAHTVSWASADSVTAFHEPLVLREMALSLPDGVAAVDIRAPNIGELPGARFYLFEHPYVCEVREALYRHGLDGIRNYFALEGDPLQEIDEEFFDALNPVTVAQPHPKDEFDFSYEGAYSIYNWELFFHAPLLLATWLKRSGRFEEAREWLHAIFNPTDYDPDGPLGLRDVWRFRPFREAKSVAELVDEAQSGSGDDPLAKWLRKVLGGEVVGDATISLEAQITAWEDDPFNPHRIARMRQVAYEKKTVRLYIENLVDWADNLFRQDTRETLNEALQLYLIAGKILGPRPVQLTELEVDAKTFNQLEPDLDAFDNALVEIESITPVVTSTHKPKDKLPPLEVAYFCVPHNESLLKLWDLVEDRLFKLRHCMNIEGVVRELPLFEPPIDPALLVRARAAGLDLNSVLADLHAPPPLHRYSILMQRAMDFAGYVMGLGQSLLAALEKKDGEELAALRGNQEVALLEIVRETRKRQVREAEQALAATKESRATVEIRRLHYAALVSDGKLNEEERIALTTSERAAEIQTMASGLQVAAQVLNMIPDINAQGVASGFTFGPSYIGRGFEAIAAYNGMIATTLRERASMQSTMAGYGRRLDEWELQLDLAEAELKQMDKQIVAAEIRVAIAQGELTSHEKQLADSRAVRDFLEDKFSNTDLYLWMAGELQTTYHEAYKLAFDMARRAERAYQFERAEPDAHFVEFGHWDGVRKGLLAADKLMLDLRKMEASYLEKDRRFFEITKSVSLAEHAPLDLIALRERGTATIDLPETLFDADYPGHYLRRIKAVSLTLPAVTGPHTSVNCTLTLLSNKIRKESIAGSSYEMDGLEDSRFLYNYAAIQSVCTSSGLNDAGMFQLDFRDERLLPFEGGGAISTWRIDLPKENNRFDLRSLSDAVIQLQYSARDAGGLLKEAAPASVLDTAIPTAYRLLSAKTELGAEWNAFENELDEENDNDQVLSFTLDGKLPYIPGTGDIRVAKIHLALVMDAPPSVTIEATFDPAGDSTTLLLGSAVLPPGVIGYTDQAAAGQTFRLTVPQAFIAGLPTELKEEHATIEGAYRLKPTVFQDLLLVLELERDRPQTT